MLNILHINAYYLDSKLHQSMIDRLQLQNVSNSVFVPIYSLLNHLVDAKSYVNAKICFKKFDRLFFYHKQRKIQKTIESLYDLKSFTLLHAHTVFTDGNVARNLYKKFGIPYIVAVRNTDVNVFFKYMFHLRNRGISVLLDAKAVVFLSPSYRDLVLNKYIPLKYRNEILSKSFIIPNGIDDFWHNNKNNLKEKNIDFYEELKIVYAGDIDSNKNLLLTCKAIDILKQEGINVDFTVAGRIVNKDEFSKISNYVNYVGIKNKEELLQIYRKSHLFIMPSHTETFGLVYAEAMSQGIPVLYTKGQGFDGQFPEGEVGYSVDDYNFLDIVEKIKSILNRYDEIQKKCIVNVDKFRWDKICEEYKKIYLSIQNQEYV